MKNSILKLLLLLFTLNGFSQTQIGTIPIKGESLPIYFKQTELDAILSKIITNSSPIVVIPSPDPVIIPTPSNNTGITISGSRYDLIKGFIIDLKLNNKQPNQISWDGQTFYNYSGPVSQDANRIGEYWLKQDNKVQKIEVKTGEINSIPFIVGSTNTAPEPVPSPIVIENSNNQSDGDFNPNGESVEMLSVNETYQVPIERNIIQMSSFSMGKNGIQGMQTYLKQYGKLLCYLYNNDKELKNGGYFNNNHPAMAQIVIKSGLLEVGYKNATNENYPIVFGLAQIANNMGYTFYYPSGLNAAFFYKQLNKNDNVVKRFNVEISDDYGWIAEKESGSLHKDLNINFFKHGKLYLDEMLWSSNITPRSSFDFNGSVSIRANSTDTRCIRTKADNNCEICLEITTKGFGETGSIKVISQNGGLSISKDMVRISGYVYNLLNYQRAEGIKNKDYKEYNNAGFTDELTKSIVQKDF